MFQSAVTFHGQRCPKDTCLPTSKFGQWLFSSSACNLGQNPRRLFVSRRLRAVTWCLFQAMASQTIPRDLYAALLRRRWLVCGRISKHVDSIEKLNLCGTLWRLRTVQAVGHSTQTQYFYYKKNARRAPTMSTKAEPLCKKCCVVFERRQRKNTLDVRSCQR